jgi:hypothetical protein
MHECTYTGDIEQWRWCDGRHGTPRNATVIKKLEKQVGEAETKLEKLKRHASWLQSQRPFIDKITQALSWGQKSDSCQIILDFWKVYNSHGANVKSLVMTIFRNVDEAFVITSLSPAPPSLLCIFSACHFVHGVAA